MDKVVKAAKATHDFNETFTQRRHKENDENTETPSVFNKRHFISSSSVVITKEARKIMDHNAKHVFKDTRRALTKLELRVMCSVVEGLKLVHRGLDHVKEALSGVVSYESYTSSEYITNSTEDMDCSCYYIINGAVEVTYDMKKNGKSRSVYQPNILYSHGAAEYIGLVSPDGVDDDLAPPATIYSREPTHILRINRYKFHKEVHTLVELLSEEKRKFLSGPACKIPLPDDIIEKILDKLTKQEYSSNKIILEQDYISEEMFLLVSGRCQLVRYISIPESNKRIKVAVGVNCGGDFFGEECILEKKGSYCEVMATSQTVCYKLHRSAFEIVQKEYLYNHIKEQRNEYPEEVSLLELGHRSCMWNYYKHKQVKSALEENGKLKYLYVPETRRVVERAPSSKLQYNENLLRFIEKGAKFEKFKPRSQSAKHTSSSTSSTRTKLQRRPRTVHITLGAKRGYNNDLDRENAADMNDSFKQVRCPVKQTQFEKEEISESHEKQLARLLSQNSDMGRQMRMAWEENGKENSGFTKSGVLATMKTEDIVRKAKELAEKQSEKIQTGDSGDFNEEWHTSVHEENENAKMFIAASKYRLAILRRKMKIMNYNKEKKEMNKKLTAQSNENRKLSYGNFVIDDKSESESDSDPEDIIADPERKQYLENWVKTDEDDEGNNHQKEPYQGDPVEKFKKAVECVDVANNVVFSRQMTIPWIKKKFIEQEKVTEQIQKVIRKGSDEDVIRFATISRRPHSSFVLSRPNQESSSSSILPANFRAMVDRPKTAVTADSGRLGGRHFKDVGILVKNALKRNKGPIQRISSKNYIMK
ncbi:hypothetical protein LOTGIDRAFT_165200 [Lottia gigantea]|uniref:Cyclic nucleotide-binding domain-containing protein n=1 Tax=Lottia gigantea TaxID=225164 RepID=V3ZWL2_LOTGI|nr:hypothetical protein LOTGIDRAFT_165200 [Lottia gigantea]ESO88787.1 hypothetical protein LOTGIDRAFT_165200 [Lottia gigantea]